MPRPRDRERLWRSYQSQAQALRAGTQTGRRAEALDAVSNAAVIRPSFELRNEAIACLALSDLEEEFSRPASGLHIFDRQLEHVVTRGSNDAVYVLRRLADHAPLQNLYVRNTGATADRTVIEALFSRGGRFFGVQLRGGATVVWDVNSGQPVFELTTNQARFNGGSFCFSADEVHRVAFIDISRPERVSIADLGTGRHRETAVPVGARRLFRLSPDGSRVVVAVGLDAVIWNAETGEKAKTLSHNSEVRGLAWDDSGRRLAVACSDGDVYIHDVAAGRAKVLAGSASLSLWTEFSGDNSKLVTACFDEVTRVWDVQSGRLLFTTAQAHGVYLNSDGTRLGFEVPGKSIGVWRVTTSAGFRSVRGQLGNGAFMWGQDLSPDGRWFAWTPASWSPPLGAEVIEVERARTAGVLPLATEGGGFSTVLFHPVEPKALTVRPPGAAWLPLAGLREQRGGAILSAPTEPVALPAGFRLWCGALGGRGSLLAALGEDGRLLALDLSKPGHFVELDGRSTSKSAAGPGSATGSGRLAASEDGRWIAVGGGLREGGVHVWDARSGRSAARFPGPEAGVAFSPDGRWLAIASGSGVELRLAESWQQLWNKPRREGAAGFGAVAFSGDGSLMAMLSEHQRVLLVDPATGGELAALDSPLDLTPTGLRLSNDGHRLAVPSANSTVEFWDLRALRHELSGLGLDWAGSPRAPAPAPPAAHAFSGSAGVILFGLVMVAIAAGMVLISLRRHRGLLENLVKAEADALRRHRELEAAKVELMHSQKMKALGTLAAGIAHDFNNLLSVIRMSNKLIGRATQASADVTEEVANIEEAVQQGKQVVGSMLGYSREQPDDHGACDLDGVVEETVSLLSKEFLSGIELTLELDRHAPPVRVSRGRLDQILLNLVVNASEAMKGRGKLQIAVHAARLGANGSFVLRPRDSVALVELSVADSGSGIAPEILPRIFEPFFTTKTTGAKQGTGLGLSMVYTIAEQDGLGLAVESAPGRGATFRVFLPCAPDAQFPAAAEGDKRKA